MCDFLISSWKQDQLVAENAQTVKDATKNAARTVDEEAEEDVQAAIAKEIKRTEKINAKENATRNEEDEAQAVDRIEEEDEEDKERAVDQIIKRVDEDEKELLRRKNNEKKVKRKSDYDIVLCIFIDYRFSIYSLSLIINNAF